VVGDEHTGGDVSGFRFDDGSRFELTGFAGGAAAAGEFSAVTCEHTDLHGNVTLMRYNRVEIVLPEPPPEPFRHPFLPYRFARQCLRCGKTNYSNDPGAWPAHACAAPPPKRATWHWDDPWSTSRPEGT
jgi:hypothetical protein